MVGRPRKFNDKTYEIMQLHATGHTVREIAFITGVPKSSVHRIVKREGVSEVVHGLG